MLLLDLIYASDLSTVEINRTHQFLQVTWLKHPNREEFKSENLIISDYILTQKVDKVLFDVRKRVYHHKADQIEDQNWLGENILPLFQHLQPFRIVYLVTQGNYETMYDNQVHGLILDRFELFKNMEVGVFVDKAESQDWLLNY